MARRDDDIVALEQCCEEVLVGDLREWHCLGVACPVYGRVRRIYPAKIGGATPTRSA